MKSRLVLVLVILQITGVCFAKDIVTKSPDGEIAFAVGHGEEGLSFSVVVGDALVLRNCQISICIDGETYAGGGSGTKVRRKTIKRTIVPTIKTVRAEIKEHCNETQIVFNDEIALQVRCFNDGAAYRWMSKLKKEKITVNSERISLNFAKDFKIYYPVPNGSGFFSHQENEFLFKKISQIDGGQKAACLPALVELGGRKYLLMSDVNVEEYPGMWIQSGGG